MTERLSDEPSTGYLISVLRGWGGNRGSDGQLPRFHEQVADRMAGLSIEVQASRKLVADLLALHHQHAPIAHFSYPYCRACQHPYPCSTVRLIEAAT